MANIQVTQVASRLQMVTPMLNRWDFSGSMKKQPTCYYKGAQLDRFHCTNKYNPGPLNSVTFMYQIVPNLLHQFDMTYWDLIIEKNERKAISKA